MRASGAQPVRTEDKKSPCRAGGPSKDAGAPCRAVHTPRVGRGGSDKTKPESLRRDSVARRCEAQRSRRRPPSAPSRAAQCSEEPGRAQHHTRKQPANGNARRHRVVVRRVRAAPCFRVRRQLRRGIGVSASLLAVWVLCEPTALASADVSRMDRDLAHTRVVAIARNALVHRRGRAGYGLSSPAE